MGYVLPLQQQLRDAGADIRLNNRALEFSYDESGKVNGVYAIDAFGDLVQYEAKFVVLATGGFATTTSACRSTASTWRRSSASARPATSAMA